MTHYTRTKKIAAYQKKVQLKADPPERAKNPAAKVKAPQTVQQIYQIHLRSTPIRMKILQ